MLIFNIFKFQISLYCKNNCLERSQTRKNVPYIRTKTHTHTYTNIYNVLQTGMPRKWREIELRQVLREKRMAAVKAANEGTKTDAEATVTAAVVTPINVPLTLSQMQGPLLVMVGGWVLGLCILALEISIGARRSRTNNNDKLQ